MSQPTGVDAERRVRFVDLNVEQSEGGTVTGTVTLSLGGGETAVGSSVLRRVEGAEVRCAAEATARALEAHSGDRARIEIDGVYHVADDAVVVVKLQLTVPGAPARALVGAGLTGGAAARAASLAVLSATNRFLGNLVSDETRMRFRGDKLAEEISLRERLIEELATRHERTAQLAESEAHRASVERELEDAESRYAELARITPALVCSHDVFGSIVSMNPAAALALEYGPEELNGCLLKEIVDPVHRHDIPDYLARVRERGSDEGLLRLNTRTGVPVIWVYRNSLQPGSREPRLVTVVGTDVSSLFASGELCAGGSKPGPKGPPA